MRRKACTRTLAFWAKVVALQGERLKAKLPPTEDAYLEVEQTDNDDEPGISVWDWWNTNVRADAHLLVIAVRHVLLHGRALAELEPEAARLLAEWNRGPRRDAETARGVLEHYDRYWIAGRGDPKRSVRGEHPIASVHRNADLTDFELRVDDLRLDLLAMAGDTFALGLALSRLWEGRYGRHIMRRIEGPDDLAAARDTIDDG
jgi:hypothetical protein